MGRFRGRCKGLGLGTTREMRRLVESRVEAFFFKADEQQEDQRKNPTNPRSIRVSLGRFFFERKNGAKTQRLLDP